MIAKTKNFCKRKIQEKNMGYFLYIEGTFLIHFLCSFVCGISYCKRPEGSRFSCCPEAFPSVSSQGSLVVSRMKDTFSGFQFDEAMMELLRKGDKVAREAVARRVVAYFDALLRHVQRKANCVLNWHDCRDVAHDFIADFFGGKLARHEGKSAEEFSKIFYTALDNFTKDRIRQIVKTRLGTENQKSIDAPLPDGERTFGDTLEDETPQPRLLPSERQEILADIRQAISNHVKGDAMKAWVLQAALLKGMKADEISTAVAKLFPGKVFANGSVYSIKSRFLDGPEFADVVRKWRFSETGAKIR